MTVRVTAGLRKVNRGFHSYYFCHLLKLHSWKRKEKLVALERQTDFCFKRMTSVFPSLSLSLYSDDHKWRMREESANRSTDLIQ